MTDVAALIIEGQLKGQIRLMPRAGMVNLEPADPSAGVLDVMYADHRQVLYRPYRLNLIGHEVWVARCGPGVPPAAADLVEMLLSDLAKQLIEVTRD